MGNLCGATSKEIVDEHMKRIKRCLKCKSVMMKEEYIMFYGQCYDCRYYEAVEVGIDDYII